MSGKTILERPRVNTLLENALMNPVVLVSAGEGYGKTCAVESFLSAGDYPVFWLPLSERDNDPSHFWESLIKANTNGIFDPRAWKLLEEAGFPETAAQFKRCCKLLEDAAQGGKKHIIVADDCHLIREESIRKFITGILAIPFPGRTFIFISRTEIDLNTMSLFSKGLLSRITTDDLRFTTDEISDFFRLKKISLEREEAEEIFSDTEGWVEAVNFIAKEMKRAKKKYKRELWEEGSFKNTAETIFTSVPLPLRRFLVIISLFEQWPLEVLERIAAVLPEKIQSVKKLLGGITQLSSLLWYDSYLHGFRIHRAFLDFLKGKQKELSQEEIKTAYSTNAKWCEENKLYIDAAINYGLAGNYEDLVKVIYSFPRLMSRQAAASLLEIIERVLESSCENEDNKSFLFLRHVTRAGLLISLGRYDEAEAALAESVREYEDLPPSPLSSRILSAAYNTLASLSLIAYLKRGAREKAGDYFRRGNYYHMRYPRVTKGPATKVSLGSYVNLVAHPPLEGEFEALSKIFTECIPHASYSMSGYLSGVDSLCRAEYAFFKGDLAAAEQNARKAVSSAREHAQYETEGRGLFFLYRVHTCNGNISSGRETLEQMKAQLEIPDYLNRYLIYDIMTGWFNAHAGQTEKIAPWLRNELGESDLNVFFHNFEAMVKAKCLFAGKKYEDVLKFLDRKEQKEGLMSFHLGMLETTVLKAAAYCRMGDESGALNAFESAYIMSTPNSFDMPFIELGEDTRSLAALALNRGNCRIPRSWLETIRNRASVYAKKLAVMREQPAAGSADAVPFLSSQELSILENITLGLTREEIAKENSLTLNAVKAGIKSIYRKLGAINRADATRIAGGLGLLKNKN